MPHSPVCAIVLNYNALDMTLACLDSLLGQVVVPDTVIVCDNGSSPEVPEKLRAWAARNNRDYFKPGPQANPATTASTGKTVLIQNRANLGYAGGNNPGIRYALQQNYFKYIWILNNDTLVKPGALKELVKCAEAQPDAGVFGSTVVFADQPETVQCAGGCTYNPVSTIFRPVHGGQQLSNVLEQKTPRLDYVFGASLFVRAEVFEKCGLLNDDYFLFYEEIDFCKRALQAGYQLAWCRESIVLHQGSASVGRPDSGDRHKRAFANYHENLSTLIFTKRYYPWLLPAVLPCRFLGKLMMIAGRGELYLVKPLLVAYRDFFAGRNQRERYGR